MKCGFRDKEQNAAGFAGNLKKTVSDKRKEHTYEI